MGKLSRPEKERRSTLPRIRLAEPLLAESLLMRQFRSFVDEVMQQLQDALPVNHEQSDPAVREQADSAARAMSESLAHFISAQTLEMTRHGSQSDLALAEEVRYLKAAVADELLLSRPWLGRSSFTGHLIETREFGSSIAGDKVFNRIQQVLTDTSGRATQLAPLYLAAVAIGFQGRYRGPDAGQALKPVRDALYKKIYNREPALMIGMADHPVFADRVLSQQAYQSVLSNIEPVRFFRFSQSTLIFLGIMLSLLLLSQVLWRWSSSSVRQALEPAAPVKIERPVSSEVGRG